MARHGKAWRGPAWQGKAWILERGATLNAHDGKPKTQTDMNSRNYKVTLTGASPLLLHKDNLEWAEAMKKWGQDPANAKASVPGDDRTPAHRWIGCLYVQGGKLVVDSDNIMTVLREGGAKCPAGKGNKTFKRETQSGIVVNEIGWPIIVNGRDIAWSDVTPLVKESDFEQHCEAARSLGFELFVKRARIGTSKHVRVRPRFDTWSISGTLTVFDETITTEKLQLILTYAGRFAGLGDWRPSSPKSPGPYGKFTAEVEEIK